MAIPASQAVFFVVKGGLGAKVWGSNLRMIVG